ncbi:hypothetical protein PI124_g2768 [Phytophthora idaei]|nr:hypothetical protein PI124_g2768 [Phytophthora idaei]
MENLFGSDYDSEEEEFKALGVEESPARDGGRSNKDLFRDEAGDRGASGGGDGDNGYSNNMWLPRAPKAPKTAKYFFSKMPNILRLVPELYTKEAIRAEMDNPSEETLSAGATNATLLLAATFSMFVGKEALTLSRQKLANSFLFVNEMASDSPQFQDSDDVVPGQESVLECHARLKEKFTIRPMTTASKPHKSLTMSMRAKHNKSRVKITDEKLRLQNRKKARQGYEYDRERSSRMDAQFLEEGYDAMDYDDDEHVGAIKEQFGKRKSSAANRKQGVRRPVPGGGFDEYRSSQRQRELEREREGERSGSDNDAGVDEGEDDEEEEKMVIRSHKKRRTMDEEDSE